MPSSFCAGSEVTQSYCPLNWSFEERQRQCHEVYGFVCNCPRCQAESLELQAEGGMPGDGEGEEDEEMDEDEGEEDGEMSAGEDGVSFWARGDTQAPQLSSTLNV